MVTLARQVAGSGDGIISRILGNVLAVLREHDRKPDLMPVTRAMLRGIYMEGHCAYGAMLELELERVPPPPY
jgi:hypothetical protein